MQQNHKLAAREGTAELQALENFRYIANYGAGSREGSGDKTVVTVPAELPHLVRTAEPAMSDGLDSGARHERWDMWLDEGIRKYAPWSSQSSHSSERAPKSSSDWQSYLEPVFGSGRQLLEFLASESNGDNAYIEHQHDLAHRFKSGALQRYQTNQETIGPISPQWMLQQPRPGHWRFEIGRVVGQTMAGNRCFVVEGVWSDGTVGSVLSRACPEDEESSMKIVSPNAAVLDWSDVLLDHYPLPQTAAEDAKDAKELTVTVVTQKLRQSRPALHERRRGNKVPILKVFGFTLLSIQK